jgi:hypothetical protein
MLTVRTSDTLGEDHRLKCAARVSRRLSGAELPPIVEPPALGAHKRPTPACTDECESAALGCPDTSVETDDRVLETAFDAHRRAPRGLAMRAGEKREGLMDAR